MHEAVPRLEAAPEGVDVEPQVSSDWIGFRLGASPGRWRYVGEMTIDREGTPVELRPSNEPSIPNTKPRSFTIGDPETQRLYEVEFDETDLELVANALHELRWSEPTQTVTDSATDEESVPKGWSGGTDDRIDRGIARYEGWPNGVAVWPYHTIGQLKRDGLGATSNGHCTATFVGSAGNADVRYILTAAHCYWDSNGNYLDPDFWPRQDGCRNSQGNSLPNCNPGPYGEWDGGVWMMYTYYTNNCLPPKSNTTPECLANDIAIQRVHRRTGASFPGAQGFGYWSPSSLNGFVKYHRGYPDCRMAGAPTPTCLARTLYGDGPFSMNGRTQHDPGNWPRWYLTSTDASGGHSGGPAYFNSAGNYYVFGVIAWGSCTGASCTETLVTGLRAITPHWYNGMLSFMGL